MARKQLPDVVHAARVRLDEDIARRLQPRRVERVEPGARPDLEHGSAPHERRQNPEMTIQRGPTAEMRAEIVDVLANRRNLMAAIEVEQRLGHLGSRASRSSRYRRTAAGSRS